MAPKLHIHVLNPLMLEQKEVNSIPLLLPLPGSRILQNGFESRETMDLLVPLPQPDKIKSQRKNILIHYALLFKNNNKSISV